MELELLRLSDAEDRRRPCDGRRRRVVSRRAPGHDVQRQWVPRHRRRLGLAGRAPGPHTRKPHPAHPLYPYRSRVGDHPSAPGVACRDHLGAPGSWRCLAGGDPRRGRAAGLGLAGVAHAGSDCCIDGLAAARRAHGRAERFNTDQGAPFTRAAFTGALQDAGSAIRRDGRGRALDHGFGERLWRRVTYEDL